MSQLESLKNELFGTRARRDMWWALLWCLSVYFLAEEMNFFAVLHDFTRTHESTLFDELLTGLVCLSIACLIYILRRNEEMRCEIERRRQSEETVRRLAHFDALTGLPNRTLLEDRLEQAVARVRRSRSKLAVFFIDLDGFKAVNDTCGHAAGDMLLREVAGRIEKQVRGHDTAARLGGDEFIVLLDAVDTSAEIEQVAQRLITGISAPWCGFGPELAVSASIGISVFSGLESCAEEHLMRHADQAMYAAKARGKNQFCFYVTPSVDAPVHSRPRTQLAGQ